MSSDAIPLLLAPPAIDSASEISDRQAQIRAQRLANLKPWKKGESGNPKGRTPKPISDKLLGMLVKHRGRIAGMMAEAAIHKALEGDVAAFTAIADRVEGKPVQRVEGEQAITITIERVGD